MNRHTAKVRVRCSAIGILATAVSALGVTPIAAHAEDSFYSYQGQTALASLAPGAVLKTRTLPYHVFGVATPIEAIQLLYRSTDSLGRATANVTSILRPPAAAQPVKVVSYQSVYDSLNPRDSPSRAIAGDARIGGITEAGNLTVGAIVASGEAPMFAPLLNAGYTVVIPDTEGPNANFGAGPEYGMYTLDSLRAARNTAATTMTGTTKIGLWGDSGGAIATNWAAIQAPTYAPEINASLVGAAEGGVLVAPGRSLRYGAGTPAWAGVVAMALVGVSRAFDIDLTPYVNDFGRATIAKLRDASILNAYLQYPGLTWAQMASPPYPDPNSIPAFVDAINRLNMGLAPIPTTPMFIAQAANGVLEATPAGGPDIGAGDGVMIAGDVRALANRYCEAGLAIQYEQYDALSHVSSAALRMAAQARWLLERFDNSPAPSSCGQIPAGNQLLAEQHHPG
ncbi:lipase family protein [Nocardia sp. NPDC051321]|uniref:lipase family protein n=1 Tax=Nocardia sp. NPDC051321 TaxID=3364323 RepID=UPI0037A6A651